MFLFILRLNARINNRLKYCAQQSPKYVCRIKMMNFKILILFQSDFQAENACPGLMFDIIMSMLRRVDSSINMTEALLKLQGHSPEFEGIFWES